MLFRETPMVIETSFLMSDKISIEFKYIGILEH